MSYPKKLLRLRPNRGLNIDIPPAEVDPAFWTIGQNIQFRRGFAERVAGYKAVYGTLFGSVYHLLNARVGTTNFWIVWTSNGVHALETSHDNDIEGAALTTATQPWQYASTLINGLPVFTNGLDKPRYWVGNVLSNFADLPGWPAGTICKSIISHAGFLFALDIDGPSGHFENQVMWSDEADPGTVPTAWTPAANNLAGSAYLSDTPGPCMCAAPLRGSLIVYKRSGVYAFDLVNDINQVFTVRTMFSSSGALTRHAVADINGRHFVVGDGDIYITDGATRISVAQGRMRDALFAQIDQTNYENLFVVFNRAKNEVWVCFPVSGATFCTQALVYDVTFDAFGQRDLSNVTCAAIGIVNDTATDETWDANTATWDSVIRAWNAENFSLAQEALVLGFGTTMQQQDTSDAVALAARVGRYDLTMDDPARLKFVRRIHLAARQNYGTLYVRAGSRMSQSDAITWTPEATLTAPDHHADLITQGRYISLEARGAGVDQWGLPGVDIEYEMRGYV